MAIEAGKIANQSAGINRLMFMYRTCSCQMNNNEAYDVRVNIIPLKFCVSKAVAAIYCLVRHRIYYPRCATGKVGWLLIISISGLDLWPRPVNIYSVLLVNTYS